jgi:hypothetical protein
VPLNRLAYKAPREILSPDPEGPSFVTVNEQPHEVQAAANDALEQRATPSRALYEHWERHQWSSLALDLETDATSFRALGEGERDGLVWMFANRFHAEFNVARLLAPFLLAAPNYELQLLLATQVADELSWVVVAGATAHSLGSASSRGRRLAGRMFRGTSFLIARAGFAVR